MAMNNKQNSNKSLYAKSLKRMLNIVKLSFSLPKMSLETSGPPRINKRSVKVATNLPLNQISGNRRAQGPITISKPVSYLIEPNKVNRSSSVINEENTIDSKAMEYITKVREKYRRQVLSEESTASA